MEEREKLWVYISKEDWAFPSQLYCDIFAAVNNSRQRYVDRLTKKQQNAINFLRILDCKEARMMDYEEAIPGVGCKVKGYGNKKLAAGMGTIRVPVTVYLLNC